MEVWKVILNNRFFIDRSSDVSFKLAIRKYFVCSIEQICWSPHVKATWPPCIFFSHFQPYNAVTNSLVLILTDYIVCAISSRWTTFYVIRNVIVKGIPDFIRLQGALVIHEKFSHGLPKARDKEVSDFRSETFFKWFPVLHEKFTWGLLKPSHQGSLNLRRGARWGEGGLPSASDKGLGLCPPLGVAS